ncbi:hypothetical protein V8F06_010280 [Rhypophila decipiens]
MEATKAPRFSSTGSLPRQPGQQPPNPPEKQQPTPRPLPQDSQAARQQCPQLQEPVPIRPPFTLRQTQAAVNPFSLQAAPTQTLQTMPTQMGQTMAPRSVMHQCYSSSHHQPHPQPRHFAPLLQPIQQLPVQLQNQHAVSTPGQQAQTFRFQDHQQYGPPQTVTHQGRPLEDQSDGSNPYNKRPRPADDVSAEPNANIVAALGARDAMIETLMTENQALKIENQALKTENQALKNNLAEFRSLKKNLLEYSREKLADIHLQLQLAGYQVAGQIPRLATESSLGDEN